MFLFESASGYGQTTGTDDKIRLSLLDTDHQALVLGIYIDRHTLKSENTQIYSMTALKMNLIVLVI